MKKFILIFIAAYACWFIYARWFCPLYDGVIYHREVRFQVNAIEAASQREDYSEVRELIRDSRGQLEWCWQSEGWFKAGWIVGPDHEGAAWQGDHHCWELSKWWMTWQAELRLN